MLKVLRFKNCLLSNLQSAIIHFGWQKNKSSKFALIFYRIDYNHCVKSVRIRRFSGPYFPAIWTEYGEILRISRYSVQISENTDQKVSEYGHFLRNEYRM